MIETWLKEETINGIKTYKTYAKIDQLKPNPDNPRDISEEKLTDLKDFLSKYPSLKPLLVDARPEKEGIVIGGNMRLRAYKELGIQEVWVELRDPITDSQAFELAVLDNQAFGHYLPDPLRESLEKFEDEIDLSKLGVELEEPLPFDELLEQLQNGQKPPKGMKYEIVIKCYDEQDLSEKMSAIAGLGIKAKQRGK